jgi:hypothetical protein
VALAHRRTVVSLLLVTMVVVSVGLPLGSAVVDGAGSVDGVAAQTDDAPANNTTAHENPESVDDEGNLSALQGWLSGRLSQSLVDCSEGLQVGRYDACNRSEGNYPEWLGKYVNVTRDANSGTGDADSEAGDADSGRNESAAFERTAENQSEYATEVRRFRRTVERYETARENGNTSKARRLARRAQRIATRVNETGARLTRGYRTIANDTGEDLGPAMNTTRTITRNVTTTAESVGIEQFVNTTITATAAARRISFREPLRVTGEVRAANGTPLANRPVWLRAGNRTRRTTTNASGAYAITYRPALLSLDTQRVTLQYRPTNRSAYRGNETSVPVEVRQVEPSLRATGGPRAVGFGDRLNASGRLHVDGTGVGAVPVAVSVDGHPLTFADGRQPRTSSDGLFRVTTRLPKEVDTGRRALRIVLPVENRALGRANASIPVVVRSTPTALSVEAAQLSVNRSAVDGPVVRVRGRLTTADGTPIRNESVALGVNGTPSAEATTGEDGRYTANVTVPEGVFAGRTGPLSASIGVGYDGAGTNLEPSRARTSLRLAVPAQPTGFLEGLFGRIADVPWPFWLAIGGALALVGGYGVYRYRRRFVPDRADPSDGERSVPSDDDRADDGERRSLLETARTRLSTGDPAGAVAVAYTAVRTRLRRDLGLTTAHTHWEFLDTCLQRDLGEHRLDALRRLTELYERAAFSRDSLSTDAAATALEAARTATGAEQRTEAGDGAAETDHRS